MLAWIRIGIALMAFGFAIARFGLFLREVTQVGQMHTRAGASVGSAWFGVAFVLLGLVTNVSATARYARLRRALTEGRSVIPSPTQVFALGIGSALVALTMAAILARTLAD